MLTSMLTTFTPTFFIKILSSHKFKIFLFIETLIFNYRKAECNSHKVSWLFQNRQKKCPKWQSQNTFHFRKRLPIPSYVGTKKWHKNRKNKKIPTLCSVSVFKSFFYIYYFRIPVSYWLTSDLSSNGHEYYLYVIFNI